MSSVGKKIRKFGIHTEKADVNSEKKPEQEEKKDDNSNLIYQIFKRNKRKNNTNEAIFDELFAKNYVSRDQENSNLNPSEEKENYSSDANKVTKKFEKRKIEETKQEFFEYAKPEDIQFSPYPKRDLFTGKEIKTTPTDFEQETKQKTKNEMIPLKSFDTQLEQFNFDIKHKIEKEFNEQGSFDGKEEVIQNVLVPDKLSNGNVGYQKNVQNEVSVQVTVNCKKEDKKSPKNVALEFEMDTKKTSNLKKNTLETHSTNNHSLREAKARIHNGIMGTLGVCVILYLQSLESLS